MFIHKLLYPIITLMIVMLLSACDRYTTLLEQMDMAENLMNIKPDSALPYWKTLQFIILTVKR